MSDLFKAAESARKLLKGFKAFEEVAQALEAAGVAEQRKAEAEAALVGLEAQRQELAAECDALTAKADAAKHGQKELLAGVESACVAMKNEAQAEAKSIVEAAQAEALGIAQQADEKWQAANLAVLDAQLKRDALLTETNELEAKLEKLQAAAKKLLG